MWTAPSPVSIQAIEVAASHGQAQPLLHVVHPGARHYQQEQLLFSPAKTRWLGTKAPTATTNGTGYIHRSVAPIPHSHFYTSFPLGVCPQAFPRLGSNPNYRRSLSIRKGRPLYRRRGRPGSKWEGDGCEWADFCCHHFRKERVWETVCSGDGTYMWTVQVVEPNGGLATHWWRSLGPWCQCRVQQEMATWW